MRKRSILFAGLIVRMGEERLPHKVMFGELVGGKGYSGGQEKHWVVHLKEDMSVFERKFEGWRKNARKAGIWFRRVEQGAASCMRKWLDTGRCKAAERHAKAAVAPSTVGTSKRPGGGGRGEREEGGRGEEGRGGGEGGVLPKRLKSGSGHHRPEADGPSNDRQKLS